jgi:tetratricopeptide (TPR) repeat protein
MRSEGLLALVLGVQAATGQTPKQAPSADEFLRSGMAAQQHGDLKAAIEAFRKALAIQPGLMEAHENLGAALAATGEFDAAISEDKQVLAVSPDKPTVQMNLALAYYKKGDLSHARRELETIHTARPLDVPAAVMLGYTYIRLGRNLEAADLLMPFEAGHETNMDLEYVLGYALIESGKATEGLPRMEKVAHTNHSAEAYAIAASTHIYRREFAEARTDLDIAIQLKPSLPGLYTMLGQVRYGMEDMEGAIPAFKTALRTDPRDFTANLYLGTILLKERDLENARPLLELALELQPSAPLARLGMAQINSMSGNDTEALKTLEDLEKTDPGWLDPHVQLAVLYYKLHRPEDGQREREIVKQIKTGQQKAGPRDK